MTRDGHPLEVESTDQFAEVRLVASDGVPVLFEDLVALAETDVVGRDATKAGGDERRDLVAIEEGPGGHAMDHEDDRGVARAFVEVVHPDGALPMACAIGDVEVVGGEGEVGEGGETGIGRSEYQVLSPCALVLRPMRRAVGADVRRPFPSLPDLFHARH